MTLTINRDYLINTLTDLVRINSVNPSLVEDGRGEAEIGRYIAGELRALGLAVTIHESKPQRPSIVGILKGKGRGRSLMLNGHMDTVGVPGMPNPFTPTIRDGKLSGRGAYDMKGSLTACLTAAEALVASGKTLNGDLLIAAVADEEYASLSTAEVIKHYKTDGAVVTEPTEMSICLAHKGFVWLEVETIGRAAHGSRFADGIDANMRMGRFLAELDQLEQELRQGSGHPLTGPPSLHAAIITGGTALSAYADRCRLKIERRTLVGESEAQVVSEIQDILNRLATADPTFQGTVKAFLTREPSEISPESSIVRTLSQASTEVLGLRPAHIGIPYWMDTALLSAAGIETVAMGPIGAGAHARVEWVDIQSLIDLAEILVHTTLNYCQYFAAGH